MKILVLAIAAFLAGCASTQVTDLDECRQLKGELKAVQAKYESAVKRQQSQPSEDNQRAVNLASDDIAAYNAALAAGSCQ